MARGAAVSEGSSGEGISHFAAIRIRVNGTGALRMAAHSLDDTRIKILVPLQMETWTRVIPTRLVNFVEQRASFELFSAKIDEVFRINRIVIFSKEIFSSYPSQNVPAVFEINPLEPISLD